jgi:type I restriction-modification system DNA methylase subunit
MARIPEKTQATLSQFVRDVKALEGETPKTHRFTALLAELFPGSKIIIDYVQGIEKLVRVDISGEEKRRRMDAYYGNAIIEFEDSLKATGKEAERQLREYTAGVWNKEGKNRRHLIPIATDGIMWRTYRPFLKKERNGKIQPEDVELELVQEFSVSDKNLDFFWMWLSILLFRKQRIEATSELFRLDFGADSQAFRVCLQIMQKIWSGLKKESEPKLAFKTWQQYLAVTYGSLTQEENDLEGLFLKHTYLACVARFLIWASLSKGKSNQDLGDVAADVLSGRYFEARKLANLVEDDFFQWVRHPGAYKELAPIWENIIAQLQTYDLSHLSEDVFKGVYQDLVDPKDRHDLGEYYTPDWLCDRMVSELLPEKGYVSVLDPSCGSGSFLRATIDHFKKANAGDSSKKQFEAILEHVAGIDIQPLAATISRATYVLALGDLVKEAKRPFTIPVYLADSLFLPTEVRQHVIGRKPTYEVTFGEQKMEIPESLVTSSELFDAAIAACTKVAADHAKDGKENKQRLAKFLDQETNLLENRPERDEIIGALWTFTDELSKLIRKKENSIWGFIVRNSYKPAMLKAQFDVILGNPPWLSYRYISDPSYQAEVKKRAVEDYAIAPNQQKLFTHMELATVFLVHSIMWFGKPTAMLGFVMPRSILSADQHTKLRTRTYNAEFRIQSYWDLYEVHPLFNVPACVLFIKRSKDRGDVSDKVPAVEWEGKLPGRDIPWPEAQNHLARTSLTARVIYLGNRDALSTAPGKTVAGMPGPYNKNFAQGATILPRNFYFVGFKDGKAGIDKEGVYWAKTDPIQAEDAKPPYDTVVMDGNVEGEFVYGTFLARHLLPFTVLEPAAIVVPVLEGDKGELSLLTSEALREKGSREMGRWMKRVEDIWEDKREDKADKQSVYQRLDYQRELTNQNLKDRHLVLYTTSGTNLSAACVDRKAYDLRLILDHKTYWASFDSEDEAYYLSAILNSEAVNDAIKPFQSLGLMGERDIHKKVLDVPFPVFNKEDERHKELVRLAKEAEARAKKATKLPSFPGHLPKQRAFIREQVAELLGQIDEIVRGIAQKQSR